TTLFPLGEYMIPPSERSSNSGPCVSFASDTNGSRRRSIGYTKISRSNRSSGSSAAGGFAPVEAAGRTGCCAEAAPAVAAAITAHAAAGFTTAASLATSAPANGATDSRTCMDPFLHTEPVLLVRDHVGLDPKRCLHLERLVRRRRPPRREDEVVRRDDPGERADRGQEAADVVVAAEHADLERLQRVVRPGRVLAGVEDGQIHAALLGPERDRVEQLGHLFGPRHEFLEPGDVLFVERELLLELEDAAGHGACTGGVVLRLERLEPGLEPFDLFDLGPVQEEPVRAEQEQRQGAEQQLLSGFGVAGKRCHLTLPRSRRSTPFR